MNMTTSSPGWNTRAERPVFRRLADLHIISTRLRDRQLIHEHYISRYEGNTTPPCAASVGTHSTWTMFSQLRLTFSVMYHVFTYRLFSCYLLQLIIINTADLVESFCQCAFVCSVCIIAAIKFNKCSVVQLARAGPLPRVPPLSERSRPILGPAPDGDIDDDFVPHLLPLARYCVSLLVSCAFGALLGLVRVGVLCLVDRWSYGFQTAEPP